MWTLQIHGKFVMFASEWIQSHSCASLIPCFKILKKIFYCGYGGYSDVSKFKVQMWIHMGCFKMIFQHPKNQSTILPRQKKMWVWCPQKTQFGLHKIGEFLLEFFKKKKIFS